jgi:thiol-disulfide isomerase/thioredoxin
LSSLTIAKRFFASALLCALAAGCRCSDDGGAKPAAARPAPASADDPDDPAAPDEGEGPDEGAEGPDETTEDPGESAGPSAPRAPLEVVTAAALREKLRASGRKGTLVNAWASFCGPCKREIPMFEKLAATLRPRGIDVVLVSVDEPGDHEKAEAWLRERKVALTSYLAARPLGEFKRGMNPRWPGMLPASFLFDGAGELRYYWGGEAFEDEVKPVLEAFLTGKPLEGESTPAVAPENAQ